jgi:hypothetical protein
MLGVSYMYEEFQVLLESGLVMCLWHTMSSADEWAHHCGWGANRAEDAQIPQPLISAVNIKRGCVLVEDKTVSRTPV